MRELCLHDENIVERRFLLRKYWDNTGLIYSRSLDTYIAKLRKYLETDPSVQIITVKGLGYKLQWGNAKLAIKTGSFFAL